MTVTKEVKNSGTLATGTADINLNFDNADHTTLVNDDVTCVAIPHAILTVDVTTVGKEHV